MQPTASSPEESLLARTYVLLDRTDASYREIAKGAGVTKPWVAKLVQRAIGDPGSKKVQRVHDFLEGREAQGKPATDTVPNPSQSLGEPGNG